MDQCVNIIFQIIFGQIYSRFMLIWYPNSSVIFKRFGRRSLTYYTKSGSLEKTILQERRDTHNMNWDGNFVNKGRLCQIPQTTISSINVLNFLIIFHENLSTGGVSLLLCKITHDRHFNT